MHKTLYIRSRQIERVLNLNRIFGLMLSMLPLCRMTLTLTITLTPTLTLNLTLLDLSYPNPTRHVTR